MKTSDHEYFYQRAEATLKKAQQATNPKVVAAHYRLAEAYLERLSSLRDGADADMPSLGQQALG